MSRLSGMPTDRPARRLLADHPIEYRCLGAPAAVPSAAVPASPEDRYLFLAVESHMADRLRDRQTAHLAAARYADEHGLDEAALEPKVLDAVFRELTPAQLHDSLRDPSTRARARAELARRAEG